MALDLLYIHPSGHLNDLVVPAGVLSCVNGVAGERRGRYAFEVEDAEIRAARVVAMDLHWAVALPGFARLARHVHAVNPRAAIVAGGITAGHYARDLLESLPLDFVLEGDSEVAFASLVGALVDGRAPGPIPNVHARGMPAPTRCRMTAAEFDRTDCLTADWFPTFQHVTNWDAAAFGQGRTLPVSRGCAMRCPVCYGSYASTFGPGVLVRSPEGLAGNLARAVGLGVRNLRLVLGKIPARTLTALLDGLVAAGPFAFDSTLGFYLCTPPSDDDLDRLETAIRSPIALSMIPPEEHVPSPGPDTLEAEREQWRSVVRRVSRSPRLHLDVWATSTVEVERLRRDLAAESVPGATISLGSVWNVTRPNDAGERPSLGALEAAMDPVWTFYAARLLSPPLAAALSPFRFLDEIPADPEGSAAPADSAATWWPTILGCWRRHFLPLLPGLRFAAVPVRRRSPGVRHRHATRLGGDLRAGQAERAAGTDPVLLQTSVDHRGVTLSGSCVVPDGADALAFVPSGPDGSVDPARVSAVLADEVILLACAPGAGTLAVSLRIQDATVAWLGLDGTRKSGGRADLGYFRPASRDAGSRGPAAPRVP